MKKFDLRLYRTKGIAMHCKTELQAKIFCNYLDSQGLTWITAEKYTTDNYFSTYEDKTLYFFNDGTYGKLTEEAKEEDYILEFDDFDWSDQKDSFIKEELKNGDIVETKNKLLYLVLNGFLIGDYDYLNLGLYNDDLIFTVPAENPNYDIEKIYKARIDKKSFNITKLLDINNTSNYQLVWERSKPPVDLTKSQIEELLGYSINIVDEEVSKS